VPDPTIEAARDVLGDALGALRATLAGVSADDLNRRLAGPSSNPLAVIAAHALSSTRSWLSLAMGAPLPERDRPAEFRTVADDDFLAWTDDRAAECQRLLEGDAHLTRQLLDERG
jgi:hypothetical protein